MMDGKSGSFPFQVMTTATTLPDSAFYKINEKQNQIKINQLIMDLASNSLSIINQNIKIQLVDVKESYWWGHSKDGLKEYLFRRGGRGGLCFAIFCYMDPGVPFPSVRYLKRHGFSHAETTFTQIPDEDFNSQH